MKQHNSVKVDKLSRIQLSDELRKKLKLRKGDKILFTLISDLVVMHNEEYGECEFPKTGMVTLPGDICRKFKWSEGSTLDVYHTNSTIILKTAT